MRKHFLTLLLCTFTLGAMATSTPSGEKERSRTAEVTPGMAAPSAATLQGELTDDMLANVENAGGNEHAADISTPEPAPVLARPATKKSHRAAKKVKSTKKESRFMKQVRKVRNRVFRHNEGGSPIMGVLSMILGIIGFIFLIVAPFAALVGSGIPILVAAGIFGLAAVILGAFGLGSEGSGRGMAMVGLVFGIVDVSIFLIAIMIIAIFAYA